MEWPRPHQENEEAARREAFEREKMKVLAAGAYTAVSLAWGRFHGFDAEDQESIEKKGWLRTALGKAQDAYRTSGQLYELMDEIEAGNYGGAFDKYQEMRDPEKEKGSKKNKKDGKSVDAE